MDTAVIEFNALADAIRAAAEDHDFLTWRRFGFVLAFVGRIKIRSVGGKLSAAGVNGTEDRLDVFLKPPRPQPCFTTAKKFR